MNDFGDRADIAADAIGAPNKRPKRKQRAIAPEAEETAPRCGVDGHAIECNCDQQPGWAAELPDEELEPQLADADLERKRKKRRKGTSPTARTLAECRKRGWIAGVVERHIPFPRPQGTKIDLFGVIDLVAIDPGVSYDMELPDRKASTLGIQACSDGRTGAGGRGSDLSARRAKILAEPRARAWVEAGNRLEIWAWGSRVRGKGRRWTLRVEAFTAESWRAA